MSKRLSMRCGTCCYFQPNKGKGTTGDCLVEVSEPPSQRWVVTARLRMKTTDGAGCDYWEENESYVSRGK